MPTCRYVGRGGGEGGVVDSTLASAASLAMLSRVRNVIQHCTQYIHCICFCVQCIELGVTACRGSLGPTSNRVVIY